MPALADFGLNYSARSRSAATQRDASLAQNAYSRFLAQQRGSRSLVDLDRGMGRGLEGLASGFSQRGLGYGGIHNRGVSDYGQNWLTQRSGIQDEMQNTLRQADFADSTAWNSYQQTEADIEAQKNADILATAAHLDTFRPFLGS